VNTRWLYYQVHGRKPARSPQRAARQYSGPARNSKYKAWVRTLGCACCGSSYRVEAAHTGSDGGAKQKASDYSCIPLCWDCHQGAADSYHRDREAFAARLFARVRRTVEQLVKELNREWKLGKEQAA
jgi:hypothetical protein